MESLFNNIKNDLNNKKIHKSYNSAITDLIKNNTEYELFSEDMPLFTSSIPFHGDLLVSIYSDEDGIININNHSFHFNSKEYTIPLFNQYPIPLLSLGFTNITINSIGKDIKKFKLVYALLNNELRKTLTKTKWYFMENNNVYIFNSGVLTNNRYIPENHIELSKLI